jgi:hypothetical protein
LFARHHKEDRALSIITDPVTGVPWSRIAVNQYYTTFHPIVVTEIVSQSVGWKMFHT